MICYNSNEELTLANKKLDGIIEAVRFAADGNIALVRIYERHGAVWSDHFLLQRNELAEQLKQGKRYAIGERKNLFGSVFNTGSTVCELNGIILLQGQKSDKDLLTGVPVF
jgi:hypothetical protein